MAAVHAVTVRRAAEIVEGFRYSPHNWMWARRTSRNGLKVSFRSRKKVFLRCVDIVNAHLLEQMSGPNANTSVPKRPG